MEKLIGHYNRVENPRAISSQKCVSMILKIATDAIQPLYPYITALPHGRLRVPRRETEHIQKLFLPYAMNLSNSDHNYDISYSVFYNNCNTVR